MGTIKIGDKKAFLLEPDKFQPVIYSTEEREIGVWTDGKPLYQKTYNLTSAEVSYNSWTNTGIDISFAETMVKAFGIALDGTFQGDFLAYNDNGTLKLQSGRNGNVAYANTLTIQYTKSTDTAGSGTWTPQGVPAHHYSTDEQVVGTYFGDTLYEKSYRNVSITSGAQWIDTGIDLGDSIVESKGVLLQTNGDILTLSSGDSGANAGINVFAKGVVTQGKWSCFFRTSNNDARGNLTLTLRYTKSS